MCWWTSNLTLASVIWFSHITRCTIQRTFAGCWSLGFTTVELPMETCKAIAILNQEGSLALMLQTATQYNTCKLFFSILFVLHAVPRIKGNKGNGISLNSDQYQSQALFRLWHDLCSDTGRLFSEDFFYFLFAVSLFLIAVLILNCASTSEFNLWLCVANVSPHWHKMTLRFSSPSVSGHCICYMP